jgi:hypothetical protein
MSTHMMTTPVAATREHGGNVDELDLDIAIIEGDEATEAWLCSTKSTDNGCDTQKQGDC